MSKRLPKFTTMVCPHCGKETKGPGFWMTRAYCLDKFGGLRQKEIARTLNVSERYVRELLTDFPNLCQHCKERITPTAKEFEIWRLHLRGVSQKQLAELTGKSVYQIRKLLLELQQKIETPKTANYKEDYPAGWFTCGPWQVRRAKARHPLHGYGWQRGDRDSKEK